MTENGDSTSASLADTLRAQNIELDGSKVEHLDEYCRLLWDWNERLNLTRHLDYDTFVARDLADTMQLSRLLGEGEEILDVGSGGGVPGIPLAILRPDLEIALSDSVVKKAKVLKSMVESLQLPVAVHAERAEKVLSDLRFDTLTARAVGPLWKICTWFQDHWHGIGQLLAIKGPRWVEERGEARHRGLLANVELRSVASYPLAGTESESVILKLWQKGRDEPGIQ